MSGSEIRWTATNYVFFAMFGSDLGYAAARICRGVGYNIALSQYSRGKGCIVLRGLGIPCKRQGLCPTNVAYVTVPHPRSNADTASVPDTA
eukprot:2585552-Rhodomonas_salina.1